jgi:hypothetical protein
MHPIIYPIIPALYAWQIYGLWIGVSVFVAMWLLLVTLASFILIKAGPRVLTRLRWMRWSVLILSMVVIGLSAAETCNANNVCQSLWAMK